MAVRSTLRIIYSWWSHQLYDCSARLGPSSSPPENKQMDNDKGGFIQKMLEWDIQSPTGKRQLVPCISQTAAFWHVFAAWSPEVEWGKTWWHASQQGSSRGVRQNSDGMPRDCRPWGEQNSLFNTKFVQYNCQQSAWKVREEGKLSRTSLHKD